MADEATPRKRRPAKQAAPAADSGSAQPEGTTESAEAPPAAAKAPARKVSQPEPPVLRGKRLEPGDRGPAVLQVQEQLERRGYPVGKLTGLYGYGTVRAVRSLQGAAGLRPTGIIDAATLTALYT